MTKVVEVAPDATVTVEDTLAHAVFDDRWTTIPCGPATVPRVTEPVAFDPP